MAKIWVHIEFLHDFCTRRLTQKCTTKTHKMSDTTMTTLLTQQLAVARPTIQLAGLYFQNFSEIHEVVVLCECVDW
jgi:hypothetical protein